MAESASNPHSPRECCDTQKHVIGYHILCLLHSLGRSTPTSRKGAVALIREGQSDILFNSRHKHVVATERALPITNTQSERFSRRLSPLRFWLLYNSRRFPLAAELFPGCESVILQKRYFAKIELCIPIQNSPSLVHCSQSCRVGQI